MWGKVNKNMDWSNRDNWSPEKTVKRRTFKKDIWRRFKRLGLQLELVLQEPLHTTTVAFLVLSHFRNQDIGSFLSKGGRFDYTCCRERVEKLTCFMAMLISFCSTVWHLLTLPEVPILSLMALASRCLGEPYTPWRAYEVFCLFIYFLLNNWNKVFTFGLCCILCPSYYLIYLSIFSHQRHAL